MGSLRGNRAQDLIDAYDEIDDIHQRFGGTEHRQRRRAAERDEQRPHHPTGQGSRGRLRRDQPSEAFKCRRCKAFIGAPLTGGRHRNHCPACLWSLHVDLKTPGDRASECRSLMEPVGLTVRRNGEQAIVHQCRGCGTIRHCRVAADDDPLLLMRLPLAQPGIGIADEVVEVGAA
ncbi:MAG TPA: RNHCP domain-containing protein [Thermomicrobiales bacterium]|nr:RNHCP domain-containing protein [Thermomicrobiales bacterium]